MLIFFTLLGGCNSDSDEEESTTSTSTTPPPPNYPEPENVHVSYITPFETANLPDVDDNSTVAFNRELNNTLIATVGGNNGGRMDILGDKDVNGLAQTVYGICIKTTIDTEMVMVMDDLGRPAQFSSGNGKIVNFDWNLQMITESDGFISCNQLADGSLNLVSFANTENQLQVFSGNQLQAFSGLADCEKLAKWFLDASIGFGFVAGITGVAGMVPLTIAFGAVAAALGLTSSDLSQDCKDRTKSCNAGVSHSGGVGQQNYYFRLGIAYGSFGLSYEFYQVPDRIDVKYEGQTIASTGCTSGALTRIIPFSGSTDDIEVIVYGDCSGNGSTKWEFQVNCPY
jgi:hypothetical protein